MDFPLPPGPDLTPPPDIRRVEERWEASIRRLESQVQNNHLAVMQQIGALAGLVKQILDRLDYEVLRSRETRS